MREPAHSEALCRRARLLLDLGRPADALAEVRRALASNPNHPECLEIEGLCHLRAGDHAEALRALARSLAEAPGRAHAHYLYGFTLREAGRASEAMSPYSEALRLAPDEPVYLRAMAELYADLGRAREGLGFARRAVEVAPDRAANHVTYGYVASTAGDKQLARAEYEKAVSLDPGDAAAWNNLGCLDLGAGKKLRARARFREALRLDPRGDRARRNLALVAKEPARRPRTWDQLIEAVTAELVQVSAPRLVLAALAIEAPVAARVLVRGKGGNAAASGAALVMALRAFGPAALVPLSVGAAVAGVAWLRTRRALPEERAHVRRLLADGHGEFERLRAQWLDGSTSRDTRDLALVALIEKLALALEERDEDPA